MSYDIDVAALQDVPPEPRMQQERPGGHSKSDTRSNCAAGALVAEIRATYPMRRALVLAEGRLTRQIKAVERRVQQASDYGVSPGAFVTPAELAALATLPLQAAREPIAKQRREIENRLKKLVKRLPVWAWAGEVRGFGPMNLAAIIGEAGDLGRYDGPAKLWKRMGLAVIDGQRQRRMSGAEAAKEHGYSAERRAVAWNLGECLVKTNGDGEYRALYLERKGYEVERNPDIKPCVAHARAKRYMEKRALRDLWRAWRGKSSND